MENYRAQINPKSLKVIRQIFMTMYLINFTRKLRELEH